jgi:hypothetical protein
MVVLLSEHDRGSMCVNQAHFLASRSHLAESIVDIINQLVPLSDLDDGGSDDISGSSLSHEEVLARCQYGRVCFLLERQALSVGLDDLQELKRLLCYPRSSRGGVMTVYVDDMGAKLGRMKMSHMIADTTLELDRMARLIGVDKKWRQHSGDFARKHYDVCRSKKALAVKLGAVPITLRQLGCMCMRRRVTGKLGNPNSAITWAERYFEHRRSKCTRKPTS